MSTTNSFRSTKNHKELQSSITNNIKRRIIRSKNYSMIAMNDFGSEKHRSSVKLNPFAPRYFND